MLEAVHATQTANRAWPCFQSRDDLFRILFYDTTSAGLPANQRAGSASLPANQSAESSHVTNRDSRKALLVRRHNVVPGMFLVSRGLVQFFVYVSLV